MGALIRRPKHPVAKPIFLGFISKSGMKVSSLLVTREIFKKDSLSTGFHGNFQKGCPLYWLLKKFSKRTLSLLVAQEIFEGIN